MTLREALQTTITRLEAGGLDNAANEARWIVSAVAEIGVTDLYLTPDHQLTAPQTEALLACVSRRLDREPLQHILGDVTFCGSTIEVTPDALIPRPETEWLVEEVLTRLPERSAWSILDIGTGTGAIAITLAARLPAARVVGMDISSVALRLARRNIRRNHVNDTVSLIRSDLHALPFCERAFDLIISNPPYILTSDIDQLDAEVRDREPVLALDGGADGLTCYRSLADFCLNCLKPGGTIALELPGHPPEPITALFTTGYSLPEVSQDWTEKPRLLTANRST